MSKYPRVILGITDSINSGAALVVDGMILAAVNEERLSRVKMPMGWPRLAVDEVLRIAGVDRNDIDAVAVATKNLYWRPEAMSIDGYFDHDWGARKNAALLFGSLGSRLLGDVRPARQAYYAIKAVMTRKRHRLIRKELLDVHRIHAPVSFIDHHLAHAASAYYTGGEADAAVITLDGAGDSLSATVSVGQAGTLKRIHEVDSYNSVGNFYSYVTHLLGFKAHKHEGKITGLAAYGKPVYADQFRELICYRDGSIHNRSRAFHTAAIEKLKGVLPDDAAREDVAASIQQILEETCVGYVSHWVSKTGISHLALAGGVVANVKLNQRLFAIDGVESIFVHPGMGDDGLGVGAALYLAAQSRPEESREQAVHSISDVYFGPSYDDQQIQACLDKSGLQYQQPADFADEVAKTLCEKRVVARFAGRMEYGPRALGNRSILVHAGDPTINDWLNKRLNRTEFMPFAPVTLEDETEKCYTDLGGAQHAARFMTITTGCS